MTRAVVFDLWGTLATWPDFDAEPLYAAVGLTLAEWTSPAHVEQRWTKPLDDYLRWIGIDDEAVSRAGQLRRAMTREALVPVDGAFDTLVELRSRGLALGLISNCSGDVADLWEESVFGDLFDAVVLSCSCGIQKPDPRIYELALRQLGVDAAESMFVGDGASDELAGAKVVGMRAVQVGSSPPWEGERISTIPELLELL